MKVELNLQELRLIVDALNDKYRFQFLTTRASYTGQLRTDRLVLDHTGRGDTGVSFFR